MRVHAACRDCFIDFVIDLLRKLFGQPGPATQLVIGYAKLDPIKFGKGPNMQLKDTDKGVVASIISAKTAEGNPAPVPTGLVWESSDPTIVIATPSDDGTTCAITTPNPGPLGSAVVKVTAPSGAFATLAVDVIASDAIAFEIGTSPIP